MNIQGSLNAKPALAVMRLMVSQQEQNPQDRVASIGMPEAATQETTRSAEASEEFYFGTGMTVTKLMFFMMKNVVGYLNGKLETGRDGDEQAQAAGEKWREQALLKSTPINSELDFNLPEPGKNDVSFGDVARLIKSKFNMGVLGRDNDLVRMLEQLIGFRLGGLNAADIVEAFADPNSGKAQEVREALEEGLAGQEGSKVSQRLERAAEGPQTVAEILADKGSPADVVDSETLEEDLEAIEVARMHEKLDAIRDMQDSVAEAVEARGPADGRADPEDAQRAIEDAMGIIQELSDAAPKEEEPETDTTAAEAPTREADGEDVADAQEMVETLAAKEAEVAEKGRSYAALAEAYGDETADWREREDDEKRIRFLI